jgi:hypothetical protein
VLAVLAVRIKQMYNPLLPDLSTLKNEDLDNKITELMQKYFFAARSGMGGVCQQIGVVLEAYKDEQRSRQSAATRKLATQNKDLDQFINVDS